MCFAFFRCSVTAKYKFIFSAFVSNRSLFLLSYSRLCNFLVSQMPNINNTNNTQCFGFLFTWTSQWQSKGDHKENMICKFSISLHPSIRVQYYRNIYIRNIFAFSTLLLVRRVWRVATSQSDKKISLIDNCILCIIIIFLFVIEECARTAQYIMEGEVDDDDDAHAPRWSCGQYKYFLSRSSPFFFLFPKLKSLNF